VAGFYTYPEHTPVTHLWLRRDRFRQSARWRADPTSRWAAGGARYPATPVSRTQSTPSCPITTAIHRHVSCERTLAGEVGVGGAVHVGLSLCSEMLRRGHGLAAVPVLNTGTISAHDLVCAAPRSSLCIRSTEQAIYVTENGSVPFSVKEIGDEPLRKTARHSVLTRLVPSSIVSRLSQGHRCRPSGDATQMNP